MDKYGSQRKFGVVGKGMDSGNNVRDHIDCCENGPGYQVWYYVPMGGGMEYAGTEYQCNAGAHPHTQPPIMQICDHFEMFGFGASDGAINGSCICPPEFCGEGGRSGGVPRTPEFRRGGRIRRRR